MITRAGWGVLAGGVILAATGRILGLVELMVLAGAGLAAAVLAVLSVARRDRPVAVRRTVHPSHVHVGSPARVELEVRPEGSGAGSVLTLIDPIGDRSGARLRLARLTPGATTRASYRLPTRRRGEVRVGPLVVERTDPLGLARRRWPAAERVRLVVLPQVDPIPPLNRPAGASPLTGNEGRPETGWAGDELHSLRPYELGDDLRRVHWPATAHRDELVVRVDEEPHQGRLTVLLDLNPDHAGPEAFEQMVSAAASIAVAHRHAGDMVRLLSTDGRDTGWVTGQVAFDGLLEGLAVATRGPGGDLAQTLAHMGDGADTVVVVTGALPDAALAALPGRRRRGTTTALTVVRLGVADGARRHRLAGVTVIDVGAGRSFASAWTRAAAGPSRRPMAPSAP